MINKEDIEKLIACKKKNSLATHLRIFLTYDFTKYYGEIRENEIFLWHSSFWLRLNYPIYLLKFKNKKLVALELKKNPIQTISEILIITLISSIFVLLLILPNLNSALLISIIYLFFSVLFILLFRNRLKTEKTNLINDFRKILEEIEKKNNPSLNIKSKTSEEKIKEFTSSKILMRIILYPVCLGIIYFSAIIFFPSDKTLYGLIGIGIGLTYLITDIYLILKKTTANSGYAPGGHPSSVDR